MKLGDTLTIYELTPTLGVAALSGEPRLTPHPDPSVVLVTVPYRTWTVTRSDESEEWTPLDPPEHPNRDLVTVPLRPPAADTPPPSTSSTPSSRRASHRADSSSSG